MVKASWLPPGGMNLFQEIKQHCVVAERSGKRIIKLSIGQPQGPALLSAREATALAVMRADEEMHGYQDNGSPGVPDFARQFVSAHIKRSLDCIDGISFLPTPGIKPMLGIVPLAIGSRIYNVGTMTEPGYPTPADQCRYLQIPQYALPLNPPNQFRSAMVSVKPKTRLLMLNYPHNPSGQIATKDYWRTVCEFCIENNIRLFNDAAYAALQYTVQGIALSDVALDYPELSWAEAFSASKLIGNGTGWRIGGMIGSPDFIGDIATIKGNTDSGFAAPMAAGVLHAIKNDQEGIKAVREQYANKLDILIQVLGQYGMKLALNPKAGFFTLWLSPSKAFGRQITDAEDFNLAMIKNTGIAGVHFGQYIRYSVCADIIPAIKEIAKGFESAKVAYV
jgi:LL-diaminopimelate aminotransferase